MLNLRKVASLLLASTIFSCGKQDAASPRRFPSSFIFGVATAGFQIDMGCPTFDSSVCDDRASDWYQWVTDPRLQDRRTALHQSADIPAAGPGFRELWAEDLDRTAKELGAGGFRLSIEWSRLFPTDPGADASFDAMRASADPAAMQWYHDVLRGIRERGLHPLVTLNHYTLPVWIHDGVACHLDLATCEKKGWLDPSTVGRIAQYAGFVAREFGGEVDEWATLNEPLAITLAGYLQPGKDRVNPPGLSFKATEALAVTEAMITGHARMYDAVHAADAVDADGDGKAASVGLVYNVAPVRPADPEDAVDVQSARNIDHLYNRLFLDAVTRGMFDADADGLAPQSRPDLANRLDWLGVNYYTRITVRGLQGSLLPAFSPLLTMDPFDPRTVLWEDAPQAFDDVLVDLWTRYRLPLVVSENGAAVGEVDGAGNEERQRRFLVTHTRAVLDAIDRGADIRGYYWWSLLDNYEWNHGMNEMRFGLYAVESDKSRRLRPVGETFRQIARERGLGAEAETQLGTSADDHVTVEPLVP